MKVQSQVSCQSLTAQRALILYSGARNSSSSRSMATVHDIDADAQGQLMILPGRFATVGELTEMVGALEPVRARCFLSSKVLAFDGNSVIWWRPPSVAQMHFNTECSIGRRTGKAQQPGLVFKRLGGGGWMVFAVKGRNRPNAKTKLFQAPHLNVDTEGNICAGNVEVPGPDHSEAGIKKLEEAYFGSAFTHPNVEFAHELTGYEGGYEKLWQDLLDGQVTKFPVDSLVPTSRTLHSLISGMDE